MNAAYWRAFRIDDGPRPNTVLFQDDAVVSYRMECQDCKGESGRHQVFNVANLIWPGPNGRTWRVCRECAWLNYGVLIAPVDNSKEEG